ncbi:hypothetical protein Q3G72_025462 [Acer saccharum]|nr:hypothetical protein Q3G72_025462 [Acer saccharum]
MKEPSLSMLLQMEFLWLISFNPSTFLKSFTLFSHSTDQVMSYEITSKPLLAVQVTELVDGIFIGIFVNHTILDATSFWHFVNSWSEISRGYECLSKPAPILDHWFLHDKDCPIHVPIFTSEQLNNRYVPPPLEQRVFHFSKETIAKLKAKANAEIGTNKITLSKHF